MVRLAGIVVAIFAVLCKSSLAISDADKTQIHAKLLEIGAQCFKEIPLTEDEVAALKSKIVETDNAKCFAACSFRKSGVFDANGNVAASEALNKIKDILTDPKDLKDLEEFLNHCTKVNSEAVSDGGKGCDRAQLAFYCLRDEAQTYGYDLNF